MPRKYVPERGDIVWLQLYPQAGHGPAIIISPKSYNQKVGLALFCPITSTIKGYPFEVVIPGGHTASGAIVSDQIKSLDWRARNATRLARAPQDVIDEVLAKIGALLENDA